MNKGRTIAVAVACLLGLLAAPMTTPAEVIVTNDWCDFWSDDSTLDAGLVPIGAVIDAYDPQGVHCGTATAFAAGSWGVMHVYADDPGTAGVDEGASVGDTITFKVNGTTASVTSGDATWASKVLRQITLEATSGGGGGFAAATLWHTMGDSWNVHPRNLADVDGDGQGDLVSMHPIEGVRVGLSDGSGFDEMTVWTDDRAFKRESWDEFPRLLGDFNGDGRDDLALLHIGQGVKVSLSTGAGFAPKSIWTQSLMWLKPRWDPNVRWAADANGDGKDDLIAFHSWKGQFVSLSDGSSFGPPQKWGDYNAFLRASHNVDPRFAADVNGDGKADAVIFNHVQGIKVSLSDGAQFLAPEWWSQHAAWRKPTQEGHPRFLADVNDDGMADAVTFDPDDGLLVGLSTGSAFADPVAWSDDAAWKWASWDSHPRMLGDVDGDGAADAVLMDAQVQVGLASE